MSWNYRVIRWEDPGGTPFYQVHEVHYEKGRPIAYTEEPAEVMSEDRHGLLQVLAMIAEGIAQPVLDVRMQEVEPVIELSDNLRRVMAEVQDEDCPSPTPSETQ